MLLSIGNKTLIAFKSGWGIPFSMLKRLLVSKIIVYFELKKVSAENKTPA